jgi:nucleoid DNA-binding protein
LHRENTTCPDLSGELHRVNLFLIFVITDLKPKLDITAFIRELLFGHDCVIVPGFGGFIGNYTPARIDKTTSTFYPPVKQISYNRNLNHNDGLLVGRISESAKINYGDARNLVEEFVEDIRKRLSKGEKVVFENIGSFIYNSEGNVQFEPDREVNYHLNSYGLTSFQVMPLEGYDVKKRFLKYHDKEPVKQASVRKILWRAAVVIPLLAVMVAVPLSTDIFRTKVQSTNLNPLASVEFENNKEAVDRGKPVDSTVSSIQPGQVRDETSSEKSSPIKEEKYLPAESKEEVFYLITGSFKSQINAESLLKKLSDEGYSPELINGPNGFYRVSAMKCSDISEASTKKDSIGRKYPGTWVIRIK